MVTLQDPFSTHGSVCIPQLQRQVLTIWQARQLLYLFCIVTIFLNYINHPSVSEMSRYIDGGYFEQTHMDIRTETTFYDFE